jgi:hypothetical protein
MILQFPQKKMTKVIPSLYYPCSLPNIVVNV